jgi:uncharacterized protein YndB with AHSA1/START domain
MFKKIGIGLVAIIAFILGLAATKDDSFTMERAITIKAPPEKIMPLLSDFKNWPTWSPWENLDPKMQRTFSGATSGKGAVYNWVGDSKVGEGRMEITDMMSPSKLVIKLDFVKPMASSNVTEFLLTPEGEQTKVTWKMAGPVDYPTKVMLVFTSLDAMIGPDFERGLAKLKTVAEVPSN